MSLALAQGARRRKVVKVVGPSPFIFVLIIILILNAQVGGHREAPVTGQSRRAIDGRTR